MADRVPCPLCERSSASIGALRHHVKKQHGMTLGEILGTKTRPLSTHCPEGHEWTEENTYRTPARPSVRHCRACRLLHAQRRPERGRVQKLDASGEPVRNGRGKLMYNYVTLVPKDRHRAASKVGS